MILILTWLGWPQIGRPKFLDLGGLFLSGLIMLLRIRRISPWLPDIGIMLSIAGAGLGGVAIASGSLVIGELFVGISRRYARIHVLVGSGVGGVVWRGFCVFRAIRFAGARRADFAIDRGIPNRGGDVGLDIFF